MSVEIKHLKKRIEELEKRGFILGDKNIELEAQNKEIRDHIASVRARYRVGEAITFYMRDLVALDKLLEK